MPFNIDLPMIMVSTENEKQKLFLHPKLSIIKNAINILVEADPILREPIIQVREFFDHLIEDHIVPEGYPTKLVKPQFRDFIRGSDSPHVKRHHRNNQDLEIFHTHTILNMDVTPNDLHYYLNGLLYYQSTHNGPQLINSDTISEIMSAFTQYYEYYNTSMEKILYEKETQLTESEKKELKHELGLNNTINVISKTKDTVTGLSHKHPSKDYNILTKCKGHILFKKTNDPEENEEYLKLRINNSI